MSSSIFQTCRVSYSLTSTTSTLRNHLRRLHLAVYVAKCKEKGWMRYLQPQEIDGRQQLASLQPCALFSPDAFLKVLVWWIVADDQVSHFANLSFKVSSPLSSLSTLLRVTSSATFFSACGKGLKTRIYPTELRFRHLLWETSKSITMCWRRN